MSDSPRHCSLDQLHLLSSSQLREITALVVADKLRYAIPIDYQNKELSVYDTRSLPGDVLDSISKARPEPGNEIVVTMRLDDTPQALVKVSPQPHSFLRVSAGRSERHSSFIYFRHSKVISDTDSETFFVIEFETIDGEPVTLWETRACSRRLHYLLKAVRFRKSNWNNKSQQAGILLEAQFPVDEIERLIEKRLEIETETHISANQTRKRRVSPQRRLPAFKPTKNKLAQTICYYASKFMSERMVEPTEKDLWAFMWNHRDQCDFELRQSTKGTEAYYLADTEINLVELRHHLSTYRVPFLGKK
tara:strand:+ start:26 stop:940 length:915 start_codon:yes stop_codon:yes gene_type:complete